MPRRNPTSHIETRQRAEVAQRQYTQVAAEHVQLKMKGEWEQRSTAKMQAKEMMGQVDHIQARQDDILVARRQRLSALLLKERDEHEAMLANLAETDENRRERLMQQARDLRKQRENLRQDEAKRKKEQLFRESSQSIRDAESRIKVLSVANQRQLQLDELKRRRAEEKAEEDFFSEQWLEQQKLQAERSQKDLEAIHSRNQQIRRDLAVQVEANQRRRGEAQDRQRQEDEEFFEAVREEKQAEKEKAAKRRAHRTELANEMKEWNAELRRMKDEEYAKLRAEDKKNLDELLAQIEAEERAEQIRKREAREQAVRHMKEVERQMNEAAESETALDKLWQEESDKEWAKREARWLQEQNRREALLRAVFESRRNQIQEIRENEHNNAIKRRQDHDEMIQQIKNLTDDDAAAARKRREAALQNQRYLQWQVDRRNAEKQSIRDGKRTEMTDFQAEEHQYQDMIARELQKLENAKPEQYKHVKLHNTKRGISGMQ